MFFRYNKYSRYALILLVSGILAGGCFFLETLFSGNETATSVSRNPAGEGDRDLNLTLEAPNIMDGEPYDIVVKEQKLSLSAVEILFEEAGDELEKKILGENESLDCITKDLYLPNTLQEGKVQVSLRFDDYERIDSNGKILWENFHEDSYLIKVTAEFSCQEESAFVEFYLHLSMEGLSEKEKLLLALSKEIQGENEQAGKESIALPQNANGQELIWYKRKDSLHLSILFLGFIGIVLIYVSEKQKKEKAAKERSTGLSRDYPNIVGQISMLTGAGMTVLGAWEKLSAGYLLQKEQQVGVNRPAFEEMLLCLREIQDGVGEVRAYERFGVRCAQPAYRKLVSLLIQGIRKGPVGMQKLLDQEAETAFTERKQRAKQLGEEAGTKLLLPMGLMLVLVFVILLVPAGISMQL
ncbi:hypothetical protein FACS1894111_08320 [Clostridia bacterium]|nr:hypothetical protein FACS1894111_08320 [Clostridia bacterium]